MSKRLDIGAVLLLVTTIVGIVGALPYVFINPFDENLLGVTFSEISSFNSNVMDTLILTARFNGLYLVTTCVLGIFVIALPFRKGEKWAWYAILVAFGIGMFSQLILNYDAGSMTYSYYVPVDILLVVLWAAGLTLSATEIFKSK